MAGTMLWEARMVAKSPIAPRLGSMRACGKRARNASMYGLSSSWPISTGARPVCATNAT